jgi:hypothetical protein
MCMQFCMHVHVVVCVSVLEFWKVNDSNKGYKALC